MSGPARKPTNKNKVMQTATKPKSIKIRRRMDFIKCMGSVVRESMMRIFLFCCCPWHDFLPSAKDFENAKKSKNSC